MTKQPIIKVLQLLYVSLSYCSQGLRTRFFKVSCRKYQKSINTSSVMYPAASLASNSSSFAFSQSYFVSSITPISKADFMDVRPYSNCLTISARCASLTLNKRSETKFRRIHKYTLCAPLNAFIRFAYSILHSVLNSEEKST